MKTNLYFHVIMIQFNSNFNLLVVGKQQQRQKDGQKNRQQQKHQT